MNKHINVILTIIIPVYNTEKFLDAALHSIINQKMENYEIIIINDGSTDKSIDVIYKWYKKFDFIKVINQENKGQGAARNIGIKNASGKYIYFMDSDDLFKENTFHRLLNRLEKNNLEALFFDAEIFLDTAYTNTNKMFSPNYSRGKSYGIYKSGEDLLISMIKNNEYTVSPCLFIVKREVLIKNRLLFSEGYIHEDDAFTSALFLNVGKSMHINDVFFYRRVRNGSTMTTKNQDKEIAGQLNSFILLDKLFNEFTFRILYNKKIFKSLVLNKLIKLKTLINEQKASPLLIKTVENKVYKVAKENSFYGLKGWLLLNHYGIYVFLRKMLIKLKEII